MRETRATDVDAEFERQLRGLATGIADDAGFCTPDSVLWRVNREPALLLAGMRALLMQIAHPAVAQGVADHSRYREDPLGRGIRTFTAMYGMLFGERDAAIAAALRVRAIHNRVHGRVTDPLPAGMAAAYDANDPGLLFWVMATLMDSAILAYELFVAPLETGEKDRFLQEAQTIGALFGIPGTLYPATWLDFKRWMAQQFAGDTLTVTPVARDVLDNLLTATLFTRLLAPFNHAVAVMLLPAPLVVRFGLRRRLRDRLLFHALRLGTRVLVRLVPRSWRGVPAARRRE